MLKLFSKSSRPFVRFAVVLATLELCTVAIIYIAFAACDPDDPAVHDDSMRVSQPFVVKEQNGLFYLLKARDEMNLSGCDQISNRKITKFLADGDPALGAALSAILKQNDKALNDAAEADRCQRFQKTPVISSLDRFSSYRWLIDLQQLRIWRAYSWFKQGREKQAMNEAFHVITIGRRLQDSGGSLTTVSAGMVIQRIGWKAIQNMLGAASLHEDEWVNFLQSPENFVVDTNGMGNAYRFEYQTAAEIIDKKQLGKLPLFYRPFPDPPYAGIFLKSNRTKNQMVQRFQELIDDVHRPYNLQSSRKNEAWRRSIWPVVFSTNPVGKATLLALTYGWDLTLAIKCMTNNDGIVTRTLIALKAYQLKNGHLPENLQALVPQYLEHPPVDDFSGGPLHYSKNHKVIWVSTIELSENDGSLALFSGSHEDTRVYKITF